MRNIIENWKKDNLLKFALFMLVLLCSIFLIYNLDFLPMIILMYMSMTYLYYKGEYK